MKTYKSSDLTHKRAEVLKEAKANGVIIQECNTNGDVRCEYVLTKYVEPPKQRFEYDAVKGLNPSILNSSLFDWPNVR